ncbi:MAG: hypothetical protein IPO58_15245 [Betaproteobacteria bacterium]|nr:hypothetical protein [Betaproteobacteria bacterium]
MHAPRTLAAADAGGARGTAIDVSPSAGGHFDGSQPQVTTGRVPAPPGPPRTPPPRPPPLAPA